MALPSLPAQGSTDWYNHYSNMHDSLDRMSQVGGVLLDDFAGGTDDVKLTAALAYAAAQTYKPAILLGNRRNDKGVIHISAGEGLIDTAWYGRANGVSEDVPFIYCEGGTVYVRNVFWQRDQSQGAGKNPVVVKTGTGKVYADNTVTVTDASGTVIEPDGRL